MKIVLIYSVISILVILSWYSPGKVIATGEEGFSLYNPSRTLYLYSSLWIDSGFGYSLPVYIPRIPFFAISLLSNELLGPSINQVFVFFVASLLGCLGVYHLSQSIGIRKGAILAGIVYFLNPFTLVQVYARFLYGSLHAWAALPWWLFLLLKWLRRPSWKLTLITSIFFLASSHVFGQIAFVIVYALCSLSVALGIFLLKKVSFKTILLNLFLFWLLWLVVNLWWILPSVILVKSSFSNIDSPKANYDSLVGVSQYFPLQRVIAFQQSYLSPSYYPNNIFFNYAPSILFFSSIAALVISKNYRRLLLPGYCIALFVCLGTNTLIGKKLFSLAFTAIPPLAALRNSYEKMGIVLVLFSAILGFHYLSKKRKIVLLLATLTYFIAVLSPVLSSRMFAKEKVIVPPEYAQMSIFLKTHTKAERLLLLPMIGGDSSKTSWGYAGIESCEMLISVDCISKIFRSYPHDQIYWDLYKKYKTNQLTNSDLVEAGITHVLVDRSILENLNPNMLENLNVSLLKKTGNLELYKNESTTGRITIQNKQVEYSRNSASQWTIVLQKTSTSSRAIFRETYSPYWYLDSLPAQNCNNFNCWEIPEIDYKTKGKLEWRIVK